jgi:hypothetical protein
MGYAYLDRQYPDYFVICLAYVGFLAREGKTWKT